MHVPFITPTLRPPNTTKHCLQVPALQACQPISASAQATSCGWLLAPCCKQVPHPPKDREALHMLYSAQRLQLLATVCATKTGW